MIVRNPLLSARFRKVDGKDAESEGIKPSHFVRIKFKPKARERKHLYPDFFDRARFLPTFHRLEKWDLCLTKPTFSCSLAS